jgi:hypothetical protein
MAKNYVVKLDIDSSGAVSGLDNLQKEIDQVNGSTTSLKAQLRAMQAQLADMDPNDAKFNELSQQAGQLKDKINDASEAVRANAGNAFEGLGNNAANLTGRLMNLDFEGVGQSAKAMGTNISNVNFSGITSGIKAMGSQFAALGKALLANPIFLIVAALVAIGMAIKGALDEQRIAVDNANKLIDASNERRHTNEKKRIAAAAGDEKKLADIKQQSIASDIKDTEAKIANLTKQQRSFYGISEEQEQQLAELRKTLSNQRVDQEVLAIERMNQLNAARVDLQKRYENIGLTSRQLTEKEISESYQRESQALVNKGATTEELYKLDAIYEDKLNQLKAQYDAEDLARRQAAAAEAKRIQKEKSEALLQMEKDEIERRKQYQVEEMEARKVDLTLQSQAEVGIKQSTTQLVISEEEKQTAAERAERERRIMSAKNAATQSLAISSQALQGIAALTELFAGKSKKAQEKAFKVQKGIRIAEAVIDTYKAASSALATYPPPFGAIAAGASIAMGLANVAKIKAQQFEGGGSSGGGGGASVSSGGGSTPTGAPSFNPINTSFLGNRPPQTAQAYVLAGNVSNAQDANEKVKNLARIG